MEGGAGEVFNIGSNSEISIGDLLAMIGRIMGVDAVPVNEGQRIRPPGSEVQRLWCDNRKLAAATGFTPRVTLEQGLAITAAWFRQPANLARYKAHIYNV